jgi:hypothetical protein
MGGFLWDLKKIPDELIITAEIIVHQVILGFKNNGKKI